MSAHAVEKLLETQQRLLDQLSDVSQELKERLQTMKLADISIGEKRHAEPSDYPGNGTWADKCVYILNEAAGQRLTTQQIVGKLRAYHTGVWSHPAIEQTLQQNLRQFPRDGFKSEMNSSNRRVYWIDPVPSHPQQNPGADRTFTLLKSADLPEDFDGKRLAWIQFAHGSKAIHIILPTGQIDDSFASELKGELRGLIGRLGLNIDLTNPRTGKLLTTHELGRAVITALNGKK